MGIMEKLAGHRKIMLDTALIIYFIEEHAAFGHVAEQIFQTICDNPYHQAFSSVITLIEIPTHPMRQLNSQLVAQYKAFLLRFANFTIYGIDSIIAEKTAELRARYGLKNTGCHTSRSCHSKWRKPFYHE